MATRTLLKLRPDVSCTTSGRIFAASGRSKCYIGTHFYCMATGGNKVTTEIPLIATRYSLIIKELSISVADVALS